MLDVFIQLRSEFALPKSIREIQYSSAQRYMVTSHLLHRIQRKMVRIETIRKKGNGWTCTYWLGLHTHTLTHNSCYYQWWFCKFSSSLVSCGRFGHTNWLLLRANIFGTYNHHCRNRQRFGIIAHFTITIATITTINISCDYHFSSVLLFCFVLFPPAVSTKFIFT